MEPAAGNEYVPPTSTSAGNAIIMVMTKKFVASHENSAGYASQAIEPARSI